MSVLGTLHFGYKLPDHCEFGGEPNPDTSVGIHLATTASDNLVWIELWRSSPSSNGYDMEREICGAAFDFENAELIASALNRWIASRKNKQG
jgi:hypothetical protein